MSRIEIERAENGFVVTTYSPPKDGDFYADSKREVAESVDVIVDLVSTWAGK